MNIITLSQRYLPHKLSTKYYTVKLYRTGVGVAFVCRRYHISKASLMHWNKKFDGTKESLMDSRINHFVKRAITYFGYKPAFQNISFVNRFL